MFEPEFANVLRVLERQGNRLSSVIRDAWDGRTLRTLTRTTSAKATGAHISIVGHITADELRRYLDRTEIANGFGNRFLWVCVRRSKSLPEGGRMHTVDVGPLVAELREAVRFAGTVGRVEREPSARELWHDVYDELSEGLPGLVGALTGRAEAQVMRIAHVYALLDQSAEITHEHLEAALEVWHYCLDSVRHVFGSSLGDPIADTILDALRKAAARASPVRRSARSSAHASPGTDRTRARSPPPPPARWCVREGTEADLSSGGATDGKKRENGAKYVTAAHLTHGEHQEGVVGARGCAVDGEYRFYTGLREPASE